MIHATRSYRTTYFRNDSQSAVTFLHDDPSLSLHHHSSVASTWVSSPEVTTDVEPDDVPYTVRYDFPYLYQADLVAWIIPKDALSSCFSTPGIT